MCLHCLSSLMKTKGLKQKQMVCKLNQLELFCKPMRIIDLDIEVDQAVVRRGKAEFVAVLASSLRVSKADVSLVDLRTNLNHTGVTSIRAAVAGHEHREPVLHLSGMKTKLLGALQRVKAFTSVEKVDTVKEEPSLVTQQGMAFACLMCVVYLGTISCILWPPCPGCCWRDSGDAYDGPVRKKVSGTMDWLKRRGEQKGPSRKKRGTRGAQGGPRVQPSAEDANEGDFFLGQPPRMASTQQLEA